MLHFFPKKTISAVLIFSFTFAGTFSAIQQKAYAQLSLDQKQNDTYANEMLSGNPLGNNYASSSAAQTAMDLFNNISVSGTLSQGISTAASTMLNPDSLGTEGLFMAYVGDNPIGEGELQIQDIGANQKLDFIAATLAGVNPATGDPISGPSSEAKHDNFWNKIATFVIKFVLQQITLATVKWINNGFQGNPAYIQDPAKFLANTADRTIGEFIFQGPLNWLCDPFKIRIQLALGLQYQPFQDKINCSLTGILNNVNGAYNDFMAGNFINGGGWDSWLQLTTQPQNNEIGAMIMAQSELDARIESDKAAPQMEANWSGGLLSMKQCQVVDTVQFKDPNGKILTQSSTASSTSTFYGSPLYQPEVLSEHARADQNAQGEPNGNGSTYTKSETQCSTVTPGSAIQSLLQKTTNTDLDQLGVANDINEIVNALANYTLKQIISKGFSSINTNPSQTNLQNQLAQYSSLSNGTPYTGSSGSSDSSGSNTGSSNSNSSVPYSSYLSSLNMTSSSQLSSLIQSKATQEGDYNTALNNLNLILNNAETVFGNANTCNASYHRDVTTGYPYMANTVKNIDGTNNSSEIMSNPQGLPQYIPVNKVWVGQHIASSTDIINRLNALNASVPNLSTTQIQTYETSVNGFTPDSTSTVSEIQGSLINWLNGVAGSYSTASCPIATSTAWQ